MTWKFSKDDKKWPDGRLVKDSYRNRFSTYAHPVELGIDQASKDIP